MQCNVLLTLYVSPITKGRGGLAASQVVLAKNMFTSGLPQQLKNPIVPFHRETIGFREISLINALFANHIFELEDLLVHQYQLFSKSK